MSTRNICKLTDHQHVMLLYFSIGIFLILFSVGHVSPGPYVYLYVQNMHGMSYERHSDLAHIIVVVYTNILGSKSACFAIRTV